jgi:hypothetical protein
LAEVLVARAAAGDLDEVASLLERAAPVLARIDLPHEQCRFNALAQQAK